MSVMSRGVLGSHATAALQVMLFPLVAFNWFSTEAGTTLAMFRLKFIYSEKATKFLRNLHLTFDYSTSILQYIQSKVRWRFRKILWPSQNIRTLRISFFCIFSPYSFLLWETTNYLNAFSVYFLLFPYPKNFSQFFSSD